MGGHHQQRKVDVGRLRTLILCGRSAGWASEDRFGKRLRDVCKPADLIKAGLSGQKLEQGHRLGRKRRILCAKEPVSDHQESISGSLRFA